MRFIDRLKNLFGQTTVIEKAEPVAEVGPIPEQPVPKGAILETQDFMHARLLSLMEMARRDYTITDLRKAAKYPMIAGIINTIIREVESQELTISEKKPEEDDALKIQFGRVMQFPNKYDRTWRVWIDSFLGDIFTVGRSYTELLRAKGGQSGKVAKAFLEGYLSADGFVEELTKAAKQPGPILGFICRDPAAIWQDGVNGFYECGNITPESMPYLSQEKRQGLTFWSSDEMVMTPFRGTTETDKRLTPPGPTAQSYPIIDILFAVLVRMRDKVDNPAMDKLISFITPSGTRGMTAEQYNDLVEAMREDIAAGTLPVLQGVRAFVDDIGMSTNFEGMLFRILEEYQLIAWQIFGAGLVQMGKMEGQGRQMGAQQMKAAEKQAVGHALQIIRDGFVEAVLINDKWSPYSGLTSKWIDATAIPTRAMMMETEWAPLMKIGGVPPGAIVELAYPEVKAILESWGVDIKTLKPPELLAAMLKAGMVAPAEEEEAA